jgi:hypothetical protein
MKTTIIQLILLIVLLFLGCTAQAKPVKAMDTIYANEFTNTALFFPEGIRQGIAGAENFVFTYNREQSQTLGLLKALPGTNSNLLVITETGHVFSFVLSYRKQLNSFHHFVPLSARIGHESGKVAPPTVTISKMEKDSIAIPKPKPKENKLETACKKLLQLPERINKSKRSQGIRLSVKNQVHYNNKVFVQLELKNSSSIDFEPEVIKTAILSGSNKRKASYQELPLKPLYMHQFPKRIQHGNTARFVLVFDKFTLAKGEILRIDIKERNGRRNIYLKI